MPSPVPPTRPRARAKSTELAAQPPTPSAVTSEKWAEAFLFSTFTWMVRFSSLPDWVMQVAGRVARPE